MMYLEGDPSVAIAIVTIIAWNALMIMAIAAAFGLYGQRLNPKPGCYYRTVSANRKRLGNALMILTFVANIAITVVLFIIFDDYNAAKILQMIVTVHWMFPAIYASVALRHITDEDKEKDGDC
jgi:hypothetical protein